MTIGNTRVWENHMDTISLVLLARLILPLSIFFFPLFGILLSMVVDTYDFDVYEFFGWQGITFEMYQSADKILDMYYLSIAFLVSRKFDDRLAKNIFLWLFIWRAVGVAIFELTGWREALFWCPNIFEPFFILYLVIKRIRPKWRIQNDWRLSVWIIVLGFFKLLQEYQLHIGNLQELLRSI